jgi:putative restriction endonuclease
MEARKRDSSNRALEQVIGGDGGGACFSSFFLKFRLCACARRPSIPAFDVFRDLRQTFMFTVAEYIHGLHAIRKQINRKQYEMLRAQYAAPNRTVTAPQLAKAVGYPTFGAVNLHYGKLGRRIAEELGRLPKRYGGTYYWFLVLSSGAHSASGYLWTMHPALATALEELGIVKNVESRLPEEVTSTEVFLEGAVRQVTVNAYERDTEARSRCIAHYGTRCFVCDFDFGSSYGESLEGYIHVHHLRQLSDIGGEYEVDPIADLRPVCPNCHAVIHSKKPPYAIEEVKGMLAQAESNCSTAPSNKRLKMTV